LPPVGREGAAETAGSIPGDNIVSEALCLPHHSCSPGRWHLVICCSAEKRKRGEGCGASFLQHLGRTCWIWVYLIVDLLLKYSRPSNALLQVREWSITGKSGRDRPSDPPAKSRTRCWAKRVRSRFNSRASVEALLIFDPANPASARIRSAAQSEPLLAEPSPPRSPSRLARGPGNGSPSRFRSFGLAHAPAEGQCHPSRGRASKRADWPVGRLEIVIALGRGGARTVSICRAFRPRPARMQRGLLLARRPGAHFRQETLGRDSSRVFAGAIRLSVTSARALWVAEYDGRVSFRRQRPSSHSPDLRPKNPGHRAEPKPHRGPIRAGEPSRPGARCGGTGMSAPPRAALACGKSSSISNPLHPGFVRDHRARRRATRPPGSIEHVGFGARPFRRLFWNQLPRGTLIVRSSRRARLAERPER